MSKLQSKLKLKSKLHSNFLIRFKSFDSQLLANWMELYSERKKNGPLWPDVTNWSEKREERKEKREESRTVVSCYLSCKPRLPIYDNVQVNM